MKKFLTVLLALSVVFTYTVGSAFAAPADNTLISADKARELVKAEYDAAVKNLDDAFEAQLEAYFPGTADTDSTGDYIVHAELRVTEAAVKAVLKAEVYDVEKAKIDDKYYGYVEKLEKAISHKDFVAFTTVSAEGNAYPKFDISEYKGYNINPDFEVGADDWNLKNGIAAKELELVKADAEAHIAAIDLNAYSKDVAAGKEESNYEVAYRLKVQAATDVANVDLKTDIGGVMAAIKAIRGIYTPAVGLADPTGALYVGGTVGTNNYDPGLNNLSKIADEETHKADLAYAKEKTLSVIKKGLTDDKDEIIDAYQVAIRVENSKAKPNADMIAELNEKIADTKAAYEAAVATFEYDVNRCTEISQLGEFDSTNKFIGKWKYVAAATQDLDAFLAAKVTGTPFKSTAYATGTIEVSDCVNNAKLVAEAKKDAEKAKAYVELDGDMAIEIEKALEDAIDEIYTTGAGEFDAPTMYTVVAKRIKELLGEDSNDSVKVGTKTYDTVRVWKSKATDAKGYDASMFDEIRTIADEAKAAIKAAKTVEDADAAFLAAYAKFDAVPTSVEHQAMFNTLTGALKADFDSYVKSLTKIATGIEAVEVGGKDYKYLDANELKVDFVKAVSEKMKAECYTKEELKAAYDEAVNTLNTLKTDTQIKTERDAVEAAVKALPVTVSLADKDAVKAAKDSADAYEEYIALVGADEYPLNATYKAALNTKYEAIKTLQKDEIKKAYDALNKKYPNDLTLADKDAVEALRAAVDAYVDMYKAQDASNADLVALEAETNTANLADMEESIEKLQVAAVEDMIARLPVNTVDADAIKAAREALNALPDGCHIAKKYYDKLVALEKLMKKEAITSVKAVKVVKNHSKAGKGYIKIAWSTVGDTSMIDGYRVYRSTKANSGYKYIFQTKNKSYKNTKNLKKGTRYYYKVRAYVELDGKRYFSDYSNKAYRAAK